MIPGRIDFALIQPLVYSLETWMTLRRNLSGFLSERSRARDGLDGVLHLVGDVAPLFDSDFASLKTLPEAFLRLLGQARDYPCFVQPLVSIAERARAEADRWPKGITLDAAASHLVIPQSGETVLVHLLSGTVDPDSLRSPDRLLQREVRAMLQTALESDLGSLLPTLEDTIKRTAGEAGKERATEALVHSGGHLVTVAHSTDPALIARMERVHEVEEGRAEDQREVLLRFRPSDPCWAHFGWSYSTVATPDRGLSYRLLFPLMAVNQAWYRYRELRGDVIQMSRAIQKLSTDRELVAQTEFYNEVLLDVKVWEAEREAFERGLRPVYRSAYDTLWTYWDTSQSRQTVNEGLDYLRDFLDRKYSVKLALRENTQARILFVIAIFQLLSVFGLVSGYLYFWENTRLPETAIYDSELFVWAVVASPIVVLLLIAWLLVSFFRRHR